MGAAGAQRKGHPAVSFDPTPHLIKLQGKDYLPVAWRLVWLRLEHPDATIDTEITEHEPGTRIVVRAKVTLPSGGSATGFKSGTPAKFRDYIEKAETGAIGRALGALGYGTQFTDDFEEGDEPDGGRAVVDSPVQRTQGQPARSQGQQQHPRPTPASNGNRAAEGTPAPGAVPQQLPETHHLDGVEFFYDPRDPSGKTLLTAAKCAAHDKRWWRKTLASGEITAWVHQDGDGYCQLPTRAVAS